MKNKTLFCTLSFTILLLLSSSLTTQAKGQSNYTGFPSDNCISNFRELNLQWSPLIGKEFWIFNYPSDLQIFGSDLNNTNFQRLIQNIQTQGIHLSMIILPTRGAVSYEYFSDHPVFNKYSITNARNSHQKTIKSLQTLGITAPDLITVADELSKKNIPFFLSQENHWSSSAAQATSHMLANIIPKEFIGEQAIQLEQSKLLNETGNFSNQLIRHCPEYKSIVPVHTYSYHQVGSVNQNTLGLFDTSNQASTILLGTSHSAMPEWGFQAYLEKALAQNIANFSVLAGGSWRSVSTYLSSPEFHASPPQHIIWELPPNRFELLLKNTKESEVQYRQLFGALNGTCLAESNQVIYKNTSKLTLPISHSNSEDANLYLKIYINDKTINQFTLLTTKNDLPYSFNITRDGFAINHGYFYFELSPDLTPVAIELPIESDTIGITHCYPTT